ncbi:MAG: DUF2953 domain-containing protein [Lachnospiraceae bacterium]|nr:DUF2953 domain-containing protein [Lachnospiraceae bacterium]
MLAYVFLVLKIIGISLLVILGVVLLLIFLVLFVPVRYKALADKEADSDGKLKATAGVSWLLGIIRAYYEYREGAGRLIIKIFGIKLRSSEEKRAARLKKQEKKEAKRAKKEEKKALKAKKKADKAPTYTMIEYDQDKEAFSEHKADISESPYKKDDKREEFKEEFKEDHRNILKNKFDIIIDKIKNIFYKIKRIYEGADEKAADIEYYVNALTNDAGNRQAIDIIKKQLKCLLKSIRPRKLKGYVDYGGEDPADTGRVLAIAAVAYPLYSPGLKVNPDFENKVLDFDIVMKGRIYGVVLLKVFTALYFNKKVKRLLKIMKKENSDGR